MENFTDRNGINVSVESLIGGRSENQDSYGTAETPLGLLIVVCDGMGGGPAGKTASAIATQAIIDFVTTENSKRHKASILADAVTSANKAVLDKVSSNLALKGMGTTCVCLLIDKQQAYIAHVGDSRCYQLRGNKVVFRTSDHSHVGEMVKHGTLTEEEARTSPYSNVITRAIGGSVTVETELDTQDYKPGDRFALMTDGIWGTIPEPQLVKFLTAHEDPSRLVPQIANNIDSLGKDNGGGHDNLTLAIVDIPGKNWKMMEKSEETEIPMQVVQSHPQSKKDLHFQKKLPLLSIILAVLCVAIVITLFFFLRDNNDNGGSPTVTAKVVNNGQSQNLPSQKKPSTDNQDATVSQSAGSYYQMAITLLDSLKSYNPPGRDLIQRKQDRDKICKEIINDIEKGIQSTPSIEKKEKAKKILDNALKNKSKLMQIDAKQYKSTKESIETIDELKKELSSIELK